MSQSPINIVHIGTGIVFPSVDESKSSIEKALRRRAWELVENLRVEHEVDRLVVRGRSSSYYGIQLVIEAVRPFLQGDCGVRVALELHVPGAQYFEVP